ncbi:hypothetical protein B0T21DRAFT_409794 [Apiosordaria backusii]|uniref:RING-type domain-containing protein n=1 Tax=Apiosordaria backusii TaxID=314023 RepID=A0AA40EI58_9PEZI|nr:hypothetical protein B0T21DRAFT_409794 [Apiosordaria backusii]
MISLNQTIQLDKSTTISMASEREEVSLWHQLKAWIHMSPEQKAVTKTPIVNCLVCLEENENLTPATPPENIANANPGIVLFCGHMMCKDCYDGWAEHLTNSGETVSCPKCRLDLVYTTKKESFEGCTHPAYAYPLPAASWQPDYIPPTKPEGGSIPNFCHPCRIESMNFLARQIRELREGGYDDFQVRNAILHSAAGALQLTDFEKQAAFPPNPDGSPYRPWVAPAPGNEENYLFVELREEVIREGYTWRGPAPSR